MGRLRRERSSRRGRAILRGPLSASASSILTSSISTSRSLYCPARIEAHLECGAKLNGPASAKSTLSICGLVIGTILFSFTARSIWSGTSDCRTSTLCRRRIVGGSASPAPSRDEIRARALRAQILAPHALPLSAHPQRGFPIPVRAGKFASVIVRSSLSRVTQLGVGWVQTRPDVHATTILTLCRFSIRNKEREELRAGYNEIEV